MDLSEKSVATYLRSNVALMRKMIADGYGDEDGASRTASPRVEAWLAKPALLRADKNAEYAAVIEIDLAEITEPILACPNDPDDVKVLSEVAGTKIDDVFLGSCMTNIGHFRAAGEIWKGAEVHRPGPHLALPAHADGPAAAQGRGVLRRRTARSAPASRSPAARCAWATRRACRTA